MSGRVAATCLEEAPPGSERLAALGGPCRFGAQADQRRQPRLQPFALRGILDHGLDGRAELLGSLLGTVRFENARLALHDLPERPEGDALAVGRTPSLPPEDDLRLVVDEGPKLRDEPALADTRLPGHRDELDRRLPQRSRVRLLEQGEIVLAPDERRLRGLDEVDAEPRPEIDRPPDRDRLGLAFDRDRLELLVVDGVARRAVRDLADDDTADGSNLLQARGRVDDIAGNHALAFLRASAERDYGLAGIDCRPHGELGLRMGLVQLGDRVEDPQRRQDGSLRVVLVRDRGTEDRHHGVADELLDRAPAALDLLLQPCVIGAQARPDVLGIGAVRTLSEADQVDEEDGDDLALLLGRRRASERGRAG